MDHIGILPCARVASNKTHLPHEWTLQRTDDSPEEVRATCPGNRRDHFPPTVGESRPVPSGRSDAVRVGDNKDTR